MSNAKRLESVDITKLIPCATNARVHSAAQIRQIRASIREFGFVNPCLIDAEYNIIAGHGRVEAARAEGIAEIPCVFVENLTDAQRKAYIIADNKLSLNAVWDEELLAAELAQLKELDFDIDITGFTSKEVRDINADKAQDAEAEIEFATELYESHNYIVLYFDNEIDWLQGLTVFDLKKEKSHNTEKSRINMGIGRVINGAQAIAKIRGQAK